MGTISKPDVGFLIPYRNREAHLVQFLQRISTHSKGKYNPVFFVMEQADGEPFNRGAMLNLGVQEAEKRLGKHAIIALHDVDMLPAPSVDYTKLEAEFVHLATCVSQFKNRMPYPDYFGGVVLTTVQSMLSIGGFPMDFWGWGGEDDALLLRVKASGLGMKRRWNSYFVSLSHEREIDSVQLSENRDLLERMRTDKSIGGQIGAPGWTVEQQPTAGNYLRFLCSPA